MTYQYKNTPPVKMSRKEAKLLWENMTAEQKAQFNKMLKKLYGGELELKEVNVDDNNQIKTIVLDDRVKPSAPAEAFYKHFNVKD